MKYPADNDIQVVRCDKCKKFLHLIMSNSVMDCDSDDAHMSHLCKQCATRGNVTEEVG